MSHPQLLPFFLTAAAFILPLLRLSAATEAAVAQTASFSAARDLPTLSPALPLAGDRLVGSAAGKQEKPQIAKGSDTSLVVWGDTRSALAANGAISVGGGGPYFGRGLGTMNDIYAARIDQNGGVIDQQPIVISRASYNQNWPQVAWNGENWLVVWYEELETDRYLFQIRAVRVSPAGVVLDATPMTIGPASNNLGSWPARVLFDGSNWVVFWQGFNASQNGRSVFAARVSASGSVLDPQGVAVYTHPNPFDFAQDRPWTPCAQARSVSSPGALNSEITFAHA